MTNNTSSNLGENLIFIISQPRSGSTLLQRVLSSHPLIHSVPEPQLLIKPLYALRHTECACNYSASLSAKGLKRFLGSVPFGEEEYLEGMRRMYGYLYERAIAGSGKTFFLDKSPRYFLVLPELLKIFPKAKYIFLLRNPLAVMGSVISTFIKQDWLNLHSYEHDLLDEPPIMLQAMESLGANCLIAHYENLVQAPERESQRMCEYIGIPFDPVMIEYGNDSSPIWQTLNHNVNQHSRPHSDSVEVWNNQLKDAQIWRVMNEYLHELGPETVGGMGYSYEELSTALAAAKPNAARLAFTFSLEWLLNKPRTERPGWEQWGVRTITSLRKRGPIGTLGLAASRGWTPFSQVPDTVAKPSVKVA